jgi:hypothetical protein
MAIAELPATILDDEELIALGGQMVSGIGRLAAGDGWFGPLAADVRMQIAAMNMSLVRDRASDLTPQIKAADAARDQAFLVLRAGLEFNQLKPEVAKRTAAENLLALIRNRDYSLQDLGLQDESVKLKALLADLAKAEAQTDLATLGLTAEVTTLDQTQKAFDALVDQRGPDHKSKKDIPSLPVVRELLRENVSVIRESLASGERRLPDTYAALADDISVHITNPAPTPSAA